MMAEESSVLLESGTVRAHASVASRRQIQVRCTRTISFSPSATSWRVVMARDSTRGGWVQACGRASFTDSYDPVVDERRPLWERAGKMLIATISAPQGGEKNVTNGQIANEKGGSTTERNARHGSLTKSENRPR
jgi:hypothetical protein